MKKIILFFAVCFALTAFCAAQSQSPETGGFRQEGIASWYGKEFQGRPTASGELFDPAQYTAAHPDLPFGTILTVTNLSNNIQVQVRVNDRGPFVKSRIIDVSQVAAEKLQILTTGTARVRLEVAPRGTSTSGYAQPVPQVAPVATAAAVPQTPAQAPVYDAAAYNNDTPVYTNDTPVYNNNSNEAAVQLPTPETTGTYMQSPVATGIPESTNPAAQASQSGRLPTPETTGTYMQSSAANGIPESTSPAAQAAQSGRLPTPVQPTIPAANPQQPAAPRTTTANTTNTAASAGAQPSTTTSRNPPTTVRTNNSNIPAYTVQEPAVKPSTAPVAMPQAKPEQITGTSKQPNTAQANQASPANTAQTTRPNQVPVQPVPAAPKPPVAAPIAGSPVMPYNSMAPAIPPAPPAVTSTRAVATYEKAVILGGPIKPGKFYRLQLGSFEKAPNAVEAFDRLSAAGLNPQWEPYGEKYRVVITSVRASDIDALAVKLGAAGFKEALAREER
ncbi:hypothetical protein FACS189494_08260 [Spirochaetia bacterium]|nr:hypothetical protein FACS189494_08260 [Spirochaetia bacterium]